MVNGLYSDILQAPSMSTAKPAPPALFVVGSFVVGVTIRVPRWLVPGETLLGDLFDLGPGGKGTNQAIAAARQGARVDLLVALGDDVFGRMARELYAAESLSLDHVHTLPGERTGCGTVTLVGGENQIALYPGANLALTPAHVAAAAPAIARARLLLAQLEAPLETILAAFRLGRASGTLNVLNPAPARPLPAELFPLIDLLTPNETEARLLLSLTADDPAPTETLARRLLDLGVSTVVITRGPRGALIADASGIRTVSAPRITSIDPTGAGDTFNGVLAHALASGLPLDEAVFRATRAGAWCATRLGVIDGIPTADQLSSFIEQHPLSPL